MTDPSKYPEFQLAATERLALDLIAQLAKGAVRPGTEAASMALLQALRRYVKQTNLGE